MTKEKVYYTADGVVLGNFWGGGKGWYPARTFNGYDTFTNIKNGIKKEFESGALDSGMGFESLEGAMMVIEKQITIDIKGVSFKNESSRKMWLGKLNKREAVEMYYSYV